jgi:hypothetical protein
VSNNGVVHNQVVRLADLRPHSRNYNVHSAAQIARIAKSLSRFGQVRSVVTWHSTILAGHGVVEAAKSLGWTELRADVVDDLSEDEALAYVVADNELARQSDPDQAQLAAILEELQAREPLLVEAAGYTDLELRQLLAQVVSGGAPQDPNQLWQGMPAFEQENVFGAIASIKVHFATQEALDTFSELVDQNVNTKTTFIWYPKQTDENLKAYSVQDES